MTTRPRRDLLLIGLCYLGFVSIGLPDGLLGVAWPSVRATFGLPVGALGALLVAFTTGYVLSSFTSGRILARVNVGALLALSCLATGASLLGYAAAPLWPIMVGLGTLAGLGAGAIDAGLNTYAATHHSARAVNWLHACYGAGATAGPILMTAVLTAGLAWRWGYAIVGMAQLALAACFALTRARWPGTPEAVRAAAGASAAAPAADGRGPRAEDAGAHPRAATASDAALGSGAPSARATLRLPAARLLIAAFFVYTGLEAAFGAWSYTLLTESRTMATASAGIWVSAYWGGLTVGRLVFGFLAGRMAVQPLLRACIAGIALGAALVWLGGSELLSGLGLTIAGLASGPVFPSLIASTPGRLGAAHAANAVGFQVAAAALGQSLVPAAIGVLAGRLGMHAIGPALLAAALVLVAVYEVLAAVSRDGTPAGAPRSRGSSPTRRSGARGSSRSTARAPATPSSSSATVSSTAAATPSSTSSSSAPSTAGAAPAPRRCDSSSGRAARSASKRCTSRSSATTSPPRPSTASAASPTAAGIC